MDEETAVAGWVAQTTAMPGVEMTRLPVEASTRSFYRVGFAAGATWRGAATAVAMHSPPATEDNARFVYLAARFRQQGLATPRVFATDLERGFLLVEDLGGRDFAAAYAAGEMHAPLRAATDALAAVQTVAGDIPPYTTARFAYELAIFTEWLIERLLGLRAPAHFEATRAALIEATQSVPQRTVHRDYHCRNLLWRDDRDGHERVGIVDFQDALVGPACYDIASLLRDCYFELDETAVAEYRQRFFRRAALDCDEPVFERAFDLTAIQRQLKAVGLFARLWLARGRSSHLPDIVPVLRRIARLARGYDETAALAAWLDAEVLPRAEERIGALP